MPIFLDIEASGLHFDSYPIEIAINLDGQISSWLIQPEPTWTYWSEEAQAMHGITRQMLAQHGCAAKQVAIEINALLAQTNGVLYSDAHAWDEDWLNILFHAAGEIRLFHLLPIEELFDADQFNRFHTARRELFANAANQRHRAAVDVAMLRQAYLQALAH
jgi:DNA polymerase III epsilon subunit-like protein